VVQVHVGPLTFSAFPGSQGAFQSANYSESPNNVMSCSLIDWTSWTNCQVLLGLICLSSDKTLDPGSLNQAAKSGPP
jgi:hypothetical protein